MKTAGSNIPQRSWLLFLWVSLLLLPALACDLGKEEPLWTPETPKQYTAETNPVEVYVVVDANGNVVDFDDPAWAYGANAQMRYVLRFWDVGILGGADYEDATIYKVYTPVTITGIKQDLESGMSEAQRADIYARTSFPTTEINWTDLTFSGGPEGSFIGTNPDTGQEVLGHMDWREKEWEMHVVFTRDIQQDYLVQGEEPFYNWP